MRPVQTLASSFRDPSGFIFERDGALYRQVNKTYRENFDHLLASGLYHALVDERLLIPHKEVDPALAVTPSVYKVIAPERIGFVSYPYEWSFSALKDAALTTLKIQKRAMEFGMSLRDASAYNIQFHEGVPTLIDTLSFEILQEGRPWGAYRQFCQHFLAPLALMAYRDIRLGQLLRVHIDGVPLDLTVRLLPTRARLRLSLLIHLFGHARAQRRYEGAAGTPTNRRSTFSPNAFRALIESLETGIRRLRWNRGGSHWVRYYAGRPSYSEAALQHKKELVAKFVSEVGPLSVWDLGANTGLLSRIAAEEGIPTVSFELDPLCVEENYRTVVTNRETKMLPLILDLANPSPSLGWANRERSSLEQRGPVDLAMALALVHHLAIQNNVPLDFIAEFFHSICRWLIVEFIPKDDPMVQALLASRDDIFSDYSRSNFESVFGERFRIVRSVAIRDSERVLYLMQRV